MSPDEHAHYYAVTRVLNHGASSVKARPVRTSAGEGMVKPVRPLEIVDGRGRKIETLTPERSRLNPFHPLVLRDPLAFRAADMRDTKTRGALVEIQERHVGHRAGRRRAASPANSWSLDVASKPPRRPRRASSWQL